MGTSENSSIFCLNIVQIILLLLTVTAIGLWSNIFGLYFLGIMVVLDTNQSLCTSSTRALLKHFNKSSLIVISLIKAFISSAGILSTPVALPFFILLMVFTNSFSSIIGSPMI